MRMTSEWTASSYEVAPDISSFDPYFSRDEIPFGSTPKSSKSLDHCSIETTMGDLGIQHFENHYILNFLPRSLVPDPLDAASPVKRRIFPGCSTSSRRGCKAWKALKKPPNDPGFSTGMVRLETLWWMDGWMDGWMNEWMTWIEIFTDLLRLSRPQIWIGRMEPASGLGCVDGIRASTRDHSHSDLWQ